MKLKKPKELEIIWDEEVEKAYSELSPKYRKFLLEYLNSGFVGSEAYRKAMNPTANTKTAAAAASRLLSSVNIKKVLEKLKDCDTEDFFMVLKVFKDAMTAEKPVFGRDKDGQPVHVLDLEDHDIRLKGAEKLAKLRGFNEPDKMEYGVNASDEFMSLVQRCRKD